MPSPLLHEASDFGRAEGLIAADDAARSGAREEEAFALHQPSYFDFNARVDNIVEVPRRVFQREGVRVG